MLISIGDKKYFKNKSITNFKHFRAPWKRILGVLILLLIMPLTATAMTFPGASWQKATPESQNVDSNSLNAALNTLKKYCGSQGLSETVVIRNGYMIWQGNNIYRNHNIWSATKSFTSTALGLLIREEKCSLSTLAGEYEPLLEENYPKVNLRHFATMTSGYDSLNIPKGLDRWKNRSEDWSVDVYNPVAPIFKPGTAFLYWDEAMMMNARVLTRIAGTTLKNYLQSRLMTPIGIKSGDWSWSTEGVVNNLAINNGCTGISMTASDMARYGHLFLNKGEWNGKQVVPSLWVTEATRNQVPAELENINLRDIYGAGTYGYNWWVNGIKKNGQRNLPDAPPGTFYGNGFNHNVCFVIPEWNMVIVRMGTDGNPSEGKEYVWNIVLRQIEKSLLEGNSDPDPNSDPEEEELPSPNLRIKGN